MRRGVRQLEWTAFGLALLVAGAVGQTASDTSKWKSLSPGSIRIKNKIEKCVTLQPGKLVFDGDIVKLQVQATFLRSTAECGCKSPLLTYRSYEQRPESRERWISSLVSARSASRGARRTFDFVLTSDSSIPFDKTVTFDLDCTPQE